MKAETITKSEYRIVWKREGLKEKRKVYKLLVRAKRHMLLLGPEPWKAFGRDPEELFCCRGGYDQCGCGGLTVREKFMEDRKNLPPIEFIRLERREVTTTPWRPSTEP